MQIRIFLLTATFAALSVPAMAADENMTSRADGNSSPAAVVTAVPPPASVTTTRTVVVDPTTTTVTQTPATVTTRYSFYSFDKNHNGRLDPGEFPAYTMTTWDFKGNGYIDADEWPGIVSTYRPYHNVNVQTFAYWDKNHDGRLEPDEVAAMVNQTGLFALYDSKHYGYVDSQEYSDALFNAYDTNGDGVIDRNEWRDAHRN